MQRKKIIVHYLFYTAQLRKIHWTIGFKNKVHESSPQECVVLSDVTTVEPVFKMASSASLVFALPKYLILIP